MKRALFWDIDGTLLTTGRAGIIAWERAAEETFGRHVSLDQLKTAGLTDTQIAARLAAALCDAPSEEQRLAVLRRYEAHLPSCLPKRAGRVLPGVVEVLDAASAREDVVNLLLTGNTRAGATAKLTHYGLERYFSDGAFSDGCPDRLEIAAKARAMLHAGTAVQSIVIGDTPHDVRCGKHIGACTIALATGEYGEDDLLACDPSLVLPGLPPPDEFFRLLEERLT
jgi:phosphoglycolate phosphatase-like HAD superfamily hydrolase